ncbi:MAG TPA: DNA-processing protein DprA [Gemmatimonadaceae bacterium]|nr:DNA-processing protein DprA [Gemmatimonadaceae bacterium]
MTEQRGARATEPVWLDAARLPACLRDLPYPPAGLWYLGDSTTLEGAPKRHVAIVGTREATAYGERVAARLAGACARAGLVVVSGLARGVDAAAHRAAIKGGQTIAVMGTGVDVPYPTGHRALHAEVQKAGAVVSEMEPGRHAGPGCFPRRNRLIAGLADVVVVIEAGHQSGAMNTANHALELGRVVAAVPGQIDDPRSAGVNSLLRDGASYIGDVDDLLALFKLSTPKSGGSEMSGANMSPTDAALLSLLGGVEQDLELLAFQAGMTARHVAQRLVALEIDGLVEKGQAGYRLASAAESVSGWKSRSFRSP